MKPGKPFEAIVSLIQYALSGQKTQVEWNVQMEDIYGAIRETDVLLTTDVNGFTMRIAIECKDWGEKVSIGDVDACHSKYQGIAGINKVVMISRSGFQSGAQSKALALGIELCQLENLSASDIRLWIPPISATAKKVQRTYSAIILKDQEDRIIDVPNPDDMFVIDNVQVTAQDFIGEIVEECIPRIRFREVHLDTKDYVERTSKPIPLSQTFLIRDGIRTQISSVEVIVRDTYSNQESTEREDVYVRSGVLTNAHSTISSDGNIFSIIKVSDQEYSLLMKVHEEEDTPERNSILEIGKIHITPLNEEE